MVKGPEKDYYYLSEEGIFPMSNPFQQIIEEGNLADTSDSFSKAKGEKLAKEINSSNDQTVITDMFVRLFADSFVQAESEGTEERQEAEYQAAVLGAAWEALALPIRAAIQKNFSMVLDTVNQQHPERQVLTERVKATFLRFVESATRSE